MYTFVVRLLQWQVLLYSPLHYYFNKGSSVEAKVLPTVISQKLDKLEKELKSTLTTSVSINIIIIILYMYKHYIDITCIHVTFTFLFVGCQ